MGNAHGFFMMMCACNSLFWVTFVPISDLTQTYVGGASSTYGNITAINMLANVFFVLFLDGTIFANYGRKRFGLKYTLVLFGGITAVGGLLRLLGTLPGLYQLVGNGAVYLFLFFGQAFAALAQPFDIGSAIFPLVWPLRGS